MVVVYRMNSSVTKNVVIMSPILRHSIQICVCDWLKWAETVLTYCILFVKRIKP